MSKKLVKTAKKQFEERLRELGLLDVWKDQGACGRIGTFVWDNDSIVIFVHEDDDDKYSEFFYPPFEELREDETFCKECLKEFACNSDDRFVASLVRWIVDKGERPLDPEDVYHPANHLLLKDSHDFEDLYEEVEDEPFAVSRSVARKEIDQYGLELEYDYDNASYYSGEVGGNFIVIAIFNECGPCRYDFGMSRKELYGNKEFQKAMMKEFTENRDSTLIVELLDWAFDTEKKPPFDLYDIVNVVDLRGFKVNVHHYSPKKNFKDEMEVFRKKMVEHIIQLCEQGMTVNVDSLTKRIALGWEDNSFVYTEDIKDLFVKKAENGEWLFCYTSYSNGRSDEYPFKYLSIETLQMFIEAMQ